MLSWDSSQLHHLIKGVAVAEWYWVLLRGEKINENQKDPGFTPGPGKLLKRASENVTTRHTIKMDENRYNARLDRNCLL